ARRALLHAGSSLSHDRRAYFSARISSTIFLISASETRGEFGGIGIGPQTPEPPFFTFSTSISTALGLPRYLAATSLYDGPTIFLSSEWHALQPSFFIMSS